MNPESHEIPNAWLALYYDGELDARRREQVESHLPTCKPCQRELAALKALSRVLTTDQLANYALVNESAQSTWRELEPRLPERPAAALPLLRLLPGIGLLMANVLVQFVAVASIVLMLATDRLGWIGQSIGWLDRALSGWFLGWVTWLLPAQWGDWSLSLFLVMLSAWLAVLYLAWMGWMWIEHHQPAVQIAAS